MTIDVRRASTGTKFIFIACMLFGLMLGAFFNPLTAQFRAAIGLLSNLRPDVAQALVAVEPFLSEVVMGLALFGLGSYLIARLTLSSFSKRILESLSMELRSRDLLSYKFEAHRERKGHRDYQEGIIFLLNSYVERLEEAHRDGKKYKEALASYADPSVQQYLKYEIDQQMIKSEKKTVAVLFADIRGFTAMVEKMLPEEVVPILNEYFAFSTEAIKANHGNVNKFIGDAVMAIFQDPPAYKEDVNDSAQKNAISAALRMIEEFHRRLPQWQDRISTPFSCDIGIGVHYGEAILGNLGSKERMEFTAIGDTVNFSSRLCSLAKPGQVWVSESCFERVQDIFNGTAQQAVAVKGKTGLHTAYVVSRKRLFS